MNQQERQNRLLRANCIKFVCLALSFFGILIACSKTEQYAAVKEKLHSVKIGMTTNAVQAIMGTPVTVFKRTLRENPQTVWVFPHSSSVSTFPQCVFDDRSGRVVAIIIDENTGTNAMQRIEEIRNLGTEVVR